MCGRRRTLALLDHIGAYEDDDRAEEGGGDAILIEL
jgi:hypothetical protein